MAKDKQVQGSATLQDPPPPEQWVGIQDVQEMHQMEDHLDHTRVEAVGSGDGKDLRRGKPHGTCAQGRSRSSAGIMRFQPRTHRQPLGLLRAR